MNPQEANVWWSRRWRWRRMWVCGFTGSFIPNHISLISAGRATSCPCDTVFGYESSLCAGVSLNPSSQQKKGLLTQPHPVGFLHKHTHTHTQTHTRTHTCSGLPAMCARGPTVVLLFAGFFTDVVAGSSGWCVSVCVCVCVSLCVCVCVALVLWWACSPAAGRVCARLFSQLVYQVSKGGWAELVISELAQIAPPPWQLPTRCQRLEMFGDSLISFCLWDEQRPWGNLHLLVSDAVRLQLHVGGRIPDWVLVSSAWI